MAQDEGGRLFWGSIPALLLTRRRSWGVVMFKTPCTTLIIGLLACILAVPCVGLAEQPAALCYAGIYGLRGIEPNLRGRGVKIALVSRSITYIDGKPQNDYRPNTEHSCLRGAEFIFHDQGTKPAGISAHSTAVCSILFGRDANAFDDQIGAFEYQGAVPEAQAHVYEFWHFLINNVFTQTPPEARLASASIGNEFEEWWTRGIEALVEHHGLIFIAGIGNGSNAYDPPLYPAAGSNVIGVGVVNSVTCGDLATQLSNFALADPNYSTCGPTSDGRCKPDIVAPGNCLVADTNDPNRYRPAGNWSSFATPLVTGTVALLVEKATEAPYLALAVAEAGGNCVIRAILLTSATKLPYWHKGRLQTDDDHTVPLDYSQGAGMVDALAAYNLLIAGRAEPGVVPVNAWDNNILRAETGPQNVYRITLPEPAGKRITATAVWNRHYGKSYPFAPLPDEDTDLRMELWAVDPNKPGRDYLLDYSDSPIDNVEHIYCAADPNFTDYEIVISMNDADNLAAGDRAERYGLAWRVTGSDRDESFYWYDLNADGLVDNTDLVMIIENWIRSRETSPQYLIGDVDANGKIDANDVAILIEHTESKADWYARLQDNQP